MLGQAWPLGGGELGGPCGDEQPQLFIGGMVTVAFWRDDTVQAMTRGQDAIRTRQSQTRWGNEGTKPGDKGVTGHGGKGGSAFGRLLEHDPNRTVGHGNDRIVRESGSVQVANHPFQSAAVTAVGGHGSMQLHAMGPSEQGRSRGVVVTGGEGTRAPVTKRHTGRKRGVEFDVLVEVTTREVAMDSAEHTVEVFGFAKPLYNDEYTGMQVAR